MSFENHCPIAWRKVASHGAIMVLAAGLAAAGSAAAWAGGTLRVAMTAGDIPVTTGNPDQGFEGYRFVGYNLYDALLLWDLSKSDKPSDIRPGLATSYEVDPNDHKRWIVHLRQDVTFHDGCKFTADDVVWNFQMRTDQNAPYFSTQQFTYTRAFLTNVKSVSKIDDYTVAFDNNFVESLFPYTLSYVLMISPCRAKEVNYDWAQYALHPSGTGPYKFDRFVPHERLELVPNTDYWDKDAHPQAGPARADPDAGSVDPHRGAADRPGRLDRGAVARCDPAAQIGRHADRHQRLPARLALHAQFHQAARSRICGCGRRPITRSTGRTWSTCSAAPRSPSTTWCRRRVAYYGHPPKYDYDPKKARALLQEAGLPAVQGDLRHLDLRLRADAALADERAGQVAARRGRVRGHAADDGLERAARRLSRRRRQEPGL